MSLRTIKEVLEFIASVGPQIRDSIRGTSGRKHALLLELQTNVELIRAVFEEGVSAEGVIEQLEVSHLSTAVSSGYNFNWVKRGKVRAATVGDAPQLKAFVGATSGDLFRAILEKIVVLKKMLAIDRKTKKVRWTARLSHLLKLMTLLLRHAAT